MTTKKQWTAAYNELAEKPMTFKTAAAAEEGFRGLATSMGITWSVALEGDIVLDEPGTEVQQSAEQADEQNHLQHVNDAVRSEEDTTPPAPPTETTKPKSGRSRGLHRTTDIVTVLVPNPKRPGSLTHARFELYRTGQTVGEFLAAGGRRVDLKWDEEHKFVSISPATAKVADEIPTETEEKTEVPAEEKTETETE